MICREKNMVIPGADKKPIAFDLTYNDELQAAVVIYSHGFNGFKDWGNFDLIADQFVEREFAFVKFNFSHNGTSPHHPEEFIDLEAFGNNNYSKELEDLHTMINWVGNTEHPYAQNIDSNKIFLIGHSMGGGIVLVKASEDKRIKGLATWAAVQELKTPWSNWTEEFLQDWARRGVAFYRNSRTGQDMPLYYQLYLDYKMNHERLNVLKAASKLQIPLLICHGTHDEAVPIDAANNIAVHAKSSQVYIVESDHVFGRKHPWEEKNLPEPTQLVVDRTVKFFEEIR